MVFEERVNLALVLSGGSARGLAHIGVLEVLEENHIPINAIVGTSMGALVGGIYCAGALKEFKEKILQLSKNKIVSLFLANRIKKGNTSTEGIEKFLKQFTINKKIEDLAIDFTSIATDLNTGKEVFLNEGSLLKSIIASIAIPGVFKPVKYKGKFLVDGGVVDPLPQKYGSLIANKTICINAMPSEFKYKKESDMFDIISEAVGIMSHELIINKLDIKKKDHLFIQLKTKNMDSFDFSDIQKKIDIGRDATKINIKKIISLVQEK